MVNSLDLDPEWGAIDLVEEIEATFDIKIANEEAERCATVGDLYDVIVAHSRDWDSQGGSCGSSMVFYRVRRSLAADDRCSVTPDTALTSFGLQPSRLFKKIGDDTELRLPAHEFTWLGNTGSYLLAGGVIAVIIALFTCHWTVSGIAVLVALAGLLLAWLDPGRLPSGIMSVADLVRRTVPLNVASLKENGGRASDRWSVLAALAAEHGVLPPDEIGPDTVFHRKQLETATS